MSHIVQIGALNVEITGDQEYAKSHELAATVQDKGLFVPQVIKRTSHQLTKIEGCASTISCVDERSKYSTEYAECFGLVAIGKDKQSDENLSCMFHGNPDYFMRGTAATLFAIQDKLLDLKARCSVGSVSVLIFGGETQPYWRAEEIAYARKISFLARAVYESFSVVPHVIRPKLSRPFNSAFYLDTQKHAAFLVQPDPVKIKPREVFVADRVPCEQMRWRVLARQVRKEPAFGCYLYQEW